MTVLEHYLREFQLALGGCDEATRRNLMEEIAGHIEEHVRALQLAGASEEEAMDETVNRFGAAHEIGGQLRAVHGRPSRREALLAAAPPALMALGSGLSLLFFLSRTGLVLGGSTPAWQAWKPDAGVLGAGMLAVLAVTGLVLVGGALVALLRRLPPWAGPWLSAVAAAGFGALTIAGEDAPPLNNALLELAVGLVVLAWILLPLALTAWRDVRSGLLAGLTMGMILAQMLVTNARALPLERFDVALLVLPLGLFQGALLYLVARADPMRRWAWVLLAVLLNVGAVLVGSAVWRDWRVLQGRPDTGFYFAFLSVCPVIAALAISAARWGWGQWRGRLVAG